jgi:hypothetical protein
MKAQISDDALLELSILRSAVLRDYHLINDFINFLELQNVPISVDFNYQEDAFIIEYESNDPTLTSQILEEANKLCSVQTIGVKVIQKVKAN